jgi:UDP-N-acetylmuramate--alanine ligase
LKLSPTIAVVTNIDREHMDYFKDMQSLKDAFLSFINKIPFYGVAFVCWENETLRELIPSVHRRFITYGLSEEADIYAAQIEKGFMRTSFDVICKKDLIGRFSLPMPGIHNVLNALACIGVARELKMEIPSITEALQSFSGIQRRFELKGEAGGIKVYDDYGHHPTEIRATLAAGSAHKKYLREKGRLFVIFQPHRYTRTADLMDIFAGSFGDADVLVLLDIYPAGEKPVKGVTSDLLAEKIRGEGHREVFRGDKEGAVEYVLSEMTKGDILLTLGAGDVWKLGEKVLERLHAD